MSAWSSFLLVFQNLNTTYFNKYLRYMKMAKLGMLDTKMDCKGSNFKGLRNLDTHTINTVLTKIISKQIEFTALGAACKEIKNIWALKDEFVRLVGASSWEAAEEAYPGYANEFILKRKFNGIPFAKAMPAMPAMVSFCRKAMRWVHG